MPVQDKTLHIKSFYGTSIPEAMEMARHELGANALLLQTRNAPPEARHLGEFEVVFGAGPESAAPASTPKPDPAPAGADDLKTWMEEARTLLKRLAQVSRPGRSQYRVVEESLIDAGVEPDLAGEIDEAVRQRASRRSVRAIGSPRPGTDPDDPTLASDVVTEIESRLHVQPDVGRIAAVIGPPGSGKTTTLVKLAITQGLALGRRVRLISADTQRVGGADQLRAFAAILGVPFQAVDSPAVLAHAIDMASGDSQILIDTPGYSVPMLSELGSELAGFLASRQDIDTHLVLTASSQRDVLRNLTAAYQGFQPRKLLFTRLDEVTSYASVFCAAAQQALPLSFFCRGQEIPEDIVPAAKRIVAASLVQQLPLRLQAVA